MHIVERSMLVAERFIHEVLTKYGKQSVYHIESHIIKS